MKHIKLALLGFLFLSTKVFGQDALDIYIQAQMTQQKIPGLSAAIIKDGKLAWVKTYGYADLDNQKAVETNTVFMMASISKTLTATGLMQLYEAGKFGLDDSIDKFLPFTVRNPNYPAVPITFRDLLTHTSSIQDNWDIINDYYTDGDSPIELEEYLRDYLAPGGANYSATLNYNTSAPGKRWQYSNIGATLIGYLVERISDMPFDQYEKENIFNPLCMERTSWKLSGLDEDWVARPYILNQGQYIDQHLYGYPDYPDGQLRTTAVSLAKFLWMNMNGGIYDGKTILKSSTVKDMLSIQRPTASGTQGLIWYRASVGNRTVWGHGGDDQGVKTNMSFDPAKKIGVIVFVNYSAQGLTLNPILTKLYAVGDTISTTGKAAISCSLSEVADISPTECEITVFPNPAWSTISVTGHEFSKDAVIQLLSLTGQEMKIFPMNTGSTIFMDISSLSDGLYILNVNDKGRMYRQKVLVQH
jgi:CubicO group peptidase (beta-lactamase class C family)